MGNDEMGNDEMNEMENVAFQLAEKWREAVQRQYGDHIGLECYCPEDVPEYEGDADIVVELTDMDVPAQQNVLQNVLPEQDVVDFVMAGMQAEHPDMEFALDPMVLPRPV